MPANYSGSTGRSIVSIVQVVLSGNGIDMPIMWKEIEQVDNIDISVFKMHQIYVIRHSHNNNMTMPNG